MLVQRNLLVLTNNLVDPASNVLDIVGSQASHRDTRVGSEVDVTLFEQSLALVGVEAEEGKHADLLEDVIPVAWCLELLCEQIEEALTHGDDAACHFLDVLLPLGEERWIREDHLDHTSAKGWRVGDFGSLNGGELGEDGCVLLGSCRDDVERTDTLTVQTSVLGETLADEQRDALARNKVSNCPSITVEITRGETLVGAVEEGKVTLLNENVGNLLPLLLGGVDTGRVVGAGV